MPGESSVQMRNQSKYNRSEVQNTIKYIIKRLVANKKGLQQQPLKHTKPIQFTAMMHINIFCVKLLVCKYKVLV